MNTRLIAPNIGRILNDADDSKHALADLAWAELRDLRAMSTRHEAMRAALERAVEMIEVAAAELNRVPVTESKQASAIVASLCDAAALDSRALLDAEKPAPRADSGGEG